MLPKVRTYEWTPRHHPQALRPGEFDTESGELAADTPATLGLGHLGMQQHDRLRSPLVLQHRNLSVNHGFESARFGVISNRQRSRRYLLSAQ